MILVQLRRTSSLPAVSVDPSPNNLVAGSGGGGWVGVLMLQLGGVCVCVVGGGMGCTRSISRQCHSSPNKEEPYLQERGPLYPDKRRLEDTED